MVEVIHDIRAMRAWLTSDKATSTLRTPVRLGYTLALFDTASAGPRRS